MSDHRAAIALGNNHSISALNIFVTNQIVWHAVERHANRLINRAWCKAKVGDIIYCKGYQRDGEYFKLTAYDKVL